MLWQYLPPETLVQLARYQQQNYGTFPDFWINLRTQNNEKAITMSPEIEEDYLAEVNRFMSQPPRRHRGGGDE